MPIPVACACGASSTVPDEFAGRRVKCPKCGEIFRLSGPATAPPGPPKVTASRPPAAKARPRPSVEDDYDDSMRPRRTGREAGREGAAASHSLGIASLVLGALSLPFSVIPCMGFLSIPISGLGLMLGVAGGIVSLARKGRGIGFPIAGAATCSLALVFGIVWLGVLASAGKAVNEVAHQMPPQSAPEKKLFDTPQTPPASPPKAPAKAAPTPKVDPPPAKAADEDPWADASKRPLTRGDVTIEVPAVAIRYVALTYLGQDTQSKEKYLIVYVRVSNRSANRKVDYETWGISGALFDKHVPRLTDNFGNHYKRVDFGFGTAVQQQTKSASIHPDKDVLDFMIFEIPLKNVEYLNLELPVSAFAGSGKDLRFRIPASMIKWDP